MSGDRLKVLMVTPLVPHAGARTGGGLVLHGQLQELSRRHDVTLLTLVDDDPEEREAVRSLRDEGQAVHAVARQTSTGWRAAGRRLRLASRWARASAPLRALAFGIPDVQQALDDLLAEETFDVVQVEDCVMGGYRYAGRCPLVLTDHEAVRAVPRSPFQGEERRRWRRFQQEVWGRFDRIQTFTEGDAERVREGLPGDAGRVSVNPFGVRLPALAEGGRERAGSLVFTGGFHHPPNVDAALWLGEDILPRVREHCPQAHLTIVGDAPPRRVRALQRRGVAVTGRVADVDPFLEAASVVVAPIREGGGMRVKVLQAMALAKAVVTTPRGAEGLLADEDALPLAVALDAAGCAEAIVGLLRDAGRRRDLGRRARRFVEDRHSWSAYGDRLDRLYADLPTPRSLRP